MTKVAIWCRHQEDNVIGIGMNIPWHISSDFKRFRRITGGQNIVAGQKTYESFPGRTLPERKIYVLTFDKNYQVSDKKNHFVVSDINQFKDFAEDLYICGGAGVYKAFMNGDPALLPDVVADSIFTGELNPELTGPKIDITPCIETLKSKYMKISADYEQDGIITSVWVKKGDFVEQKVIRHILNAIENKGEDK